MYQDITKSVPKGEGPAIFIQIYSDDIDRDAMGKSSGRNKLHLTYLRILNITDGIARSPRQYNLLQV
jgi:hypothetical protein